MLLEFHIVTATTGGPATAHPLVRYGMVLPKEDCLPNLLTHSVLEYILLRWANPLAIGIGIGRRHSFSCHIYRCLSRVK